MKDQDMRHSIVIAGLLIVALPLYAQEEPSPNAAGPEDSAILEASRLPDETAARFQARLDDIEGLKVSVRSLTFLIACDTGGGPPGLRRLNSLRVVMPPR